MKNYLNKILRGDSLEVLKQIPDNIVTKSVLGLFLL